ncbi:MipA/OmpV family protein [Erythrobacter sp. HL-111]|uniref:MipA/OmpV family protein n=1 Tax=Erythrobacter sp. HL-111 TaxID=1798193 RepID=UPI0006DA70F3|nr:MipA/OmpV family protein [Erythrobacter sp. HL-111]KPP87954.1 MAG: Outer membrane protein V [Erythrobacteraceae bacterium HL-111]SDS43750.1 Outer membrane scaffolding protein for murein synthesis, MipA/OmpV family [Erythrobacter sp. HL-111]
MKSPPPFSLPLSSALALALAAPAAAGEAHALRAEPAALGADRVTAGAEGDAGFDLAAAKGAQDAPASAAPQDGAQQEQEREQEPEPAREEEAPADARLPTGMQGMKPVFDRNWVTLGLGAGLVPSYAGSDDYIVFPLPLIVGRLGGVGLNPNGPGITLNLLSQRAVPGQPGGTSFQFGPAFRIRNDRNARIVDEVVEAAGKLDVAAEVGVNAGVSFPRVLNRFDSLTVATQVRWDILGAHNGMLVEPNIGYTTPLGPATVINLQVGMQFVDDSFADYYFTVDPAQSAASGLPQFRADGGLNSAGTTAIINYDLSGNVLDGGFSIYGVAGYSRLFGDAQDTPYTALRGNPDQFIGGIGVGYTF